MNNVLEMLENTALRYGDKVAFADRCMEITYSEAVNLAQKLGSSLACSGNRRAAIAVLVPKSAKMLISFLGTIYSGNFYVPIDSEMPVDRMHLVFECINPVKIIVDGKTAKLDLGKYNPLKVGYEQLLTQDSDLSLLKEIRKSAIDTDPIYALFTSGSTGVPKGVIVCHRSVIDYAGWCVKTFHFDQNTIFGNQTPFYFSMSVLDIYSTIRSGATLHIIPKMLFTFPADLVEYLNEKKINAIYWVPSALCLVAKSNILTKMELPFLKKILFAGEVMPTRQLNIWRSHLPDALYANLFGPTEITDIGVFYIVDREFRDEESIPIGNACENVDIFVLDERMNPVTEPGVTGELYFRGSYLAHGYYNNWEKTAEAFVQNPLNTAYPEVVYKTGDLVCWNEYGELVYVSRKDFQIKHMGYRIELGEIENAAGVYAQVDRCAAVYDCEKDEIVLFYEGKSCEAKSLKAHLKSKLPSYMMPGRLIRMDKLMLNENGKINRKELMRIITEERAEC